ncbi:hypothetical protein PYR74_05090 [Acinetobacter bereziniae]|nr:hypothetical protein PYR74_05090 [Acinetobacter bereziniae]
MARQGQSVSVEQISDPQAPQLANVQANYGRGNSGTRLAELSIEKNSVTQLLVFELGVLPWEPISM